jgi:hypothetical protein
LEAQAPFDVPRQELRRDRGAHVVRDEHDGLALVPRRDRLGQVGLGQQRVDMIARLVGEPEAEEVERGQTAAGQQPGH